MTPGIHALTIAEYLADPCPEPSLNASTAHTLITKSPLHAWHGSQKLNPNAKRESSTTFDDGAIKHALLLENDSSRIVIVQADDWRTNKAKEARDAAWAAGGLPILERKMEAIHEQVEAARRYVAQSELAGLFDNGRAEMTLVWTESDGDEKSGKIWCRARPDFITNDMRVMVDLKTTDGSADPYSFSRVIPALGYSLQAVHYTRGLNTLYRDAHPSFVFLVQENDPPYACSLVGCAPAMLDLAERQLDYARGLWRRCLASGKWSGYPSTVAWAEPPQWEMTRWEERADQGIVQV